MKLNGPKSKATLFAGVCLLLGLNWSLAVLSGRGKSPAYDETAHLTAGYAYWRFNDFRLQPENGNFPQRWVALPLVASSDLRFPSLDQPAWQSSDVDALGQQFLHGLGNPLESMLWRSRACSALLGVGVCLIVYCWSSQLWGPWSGLLSLLLAACPTMLAHGGLATSDMAAALCFALAVWCLWALLECITPWRVLGSAIATSLLLLSKTSAVLILPMALLMVLAHWLIRRRLMVRWRGSMYELRSPLKRLAAVAVVLALHAAVAWLSIWSAYGWRFSTGAPGMPRTELFAYGTLPAVAQRAGLGGRLIEAVGRARLLPEAYLYGTAYVLAESQQRAAFLNGDYSATGWRHYFPYCALVKTPLPLFGLLALSAIGIVASWRTSPLSLYQRACQGDIVWKMIPLLILLVVYWLAAIASSLNIGHRHLLPTYPPLFILAGGAAHWCMNKRLKTVVCSLLVILFAAETIRAYPHYLAYFNPLVPRQRAYRHLIDSNLDWGQDLAGLKQWLDTQPASLRNQPVYLSYFGTGSPEYYGIHATRLPLKSVREVSDSLQAGTYCISATNVQAVYLAAPGRWNQTYERDYQSLATMLQSPDSSEDQQQLARLREGFAELQFARLLAFLRQREPDDQIGYSILIYRLTAADVQIAMQGDPAELDSMSWQEAESRRRQ